jgi:hypothetical protein
MTPTEPITQATDLRRRRCRHFWSVADAAPLATVPLPPTGSAEQKYREPRTGAARSLSPPSAAATGDREQKL